ncbi:MAG: potassium transporter TrkH [Hyphomicrobiales bacterium]|nr:MAG: potassium transporter TrkH [Hyphomicrobiales bacterium]
MAREILPILKIIGVLLIIMGAVMAIPALVDLAYDNQDWIVFAGSSGVSLFFGTSLVLSQNTPIERLSARQALLIVNLAWLGCAAVGSVPFMLSHLQMSVTDAMFESMSGITTTGSTVLTGLDGLPPGILLWRGILQWLGGLGKVFSRAGQISAGLTAVYSLLTFIWMLALWFAGMNGLESAVHAMTTIATGGFSTSDGSISHFDSALIEAIIICGMIAGGIPFLAYVRFAQGRRSQLIRDAEIRAFLTILAFAALAVTLWLMVTMKMSVPEAFRYAAFNVTSVMTGTGYASTDYYLWGAFPIAMLMFLTLVGGCTGSTACGMKVFRFQILFRAATIQLRRIIMPSSVENLEYKGKRVGDNTMASIQSYFYLFAISLAGLAIALAATGLDLVTAISGAATALANVGPGLGEIIGPSGTFQPLPDSSKWLLTTGMYVGRLELLTVYALFTRMFWST